MKKTTTLTNTDFRFIQASNIYMLGKSIFNQTIKVRDINQSETILIENVSHTDLGQGSLQTNYVSDFQIKPLFMFFDEESSVLIRHSQFVDFEAMKENEPKVFENVSKPVVFYQLMICTKISKAQISQLEEIINQAHEVKFGLKIQNISITCEEWTNHLDPDELDDYLEMVYAEN